MIPQTMTLKEYLNEGDRFAANNGIQIIEIGEGSAKAEMTVTDGHLNAGGVCQGGAIFTLADLVFAAIVNQRENLTFAISSTIYYHISAHKGDVLTAEGRFASDHKKVPVVEVVIRNQDGFNIATFTGQAYASRTPLDISIA